MKIYPKNYEAPATESKITETPADVIAEVKALIKTYVNVPMEYDAVIKHVEKTRGLSDIINIVAIIDEVRDEWQPVAVEAKAK